MNRTVEVLRKLVENGWTIGEFEAFHKPTGKSYPINWIKTFNDSELQHFFDTKCIYVMPWSKFEEGYKMIFNTPGLPQPSPENIQAHVNDVNEHIANTAKCIGTLSSAMIKRGVDHDASKFSEEELSYYATYTPSLKGLTYGSEEYKDNLKLMKPAVDHHYAKNSHHPEHYEDGIDDMDLVDIVEMLCDWKAATMRHADGNLLKSMLINKTRFNMDDQLYHVLLNTVERYFKD